MVLTVGQIIAICILGVGVLLSIAFTIAFAVVSLRKENSRTAAREEKNEEKEEVNEIDLDEMLAKLEDLSKQKQTEKEVKEEPKIVVNVYEAEKAEPVVEEAVVEEVKEEVKESDIEERLAALEELSKQKQAEEKQEPEVQTIIIDRSAPEFDYRIRLEKIKESQAKLDRDLEKTTRAITKYERTIRRMERNKKILDRKALELTNLNLLMYSVTDIKNVDAEKKARQEELTAHIAELKASIQDAEKYIETNREKHESNLKLKDYLTGEQKRYADEVKELESLIAEGKFSDDD